MRFVPSIAWKCINAIMIVSLLFNYFPPQSTVTAASNNPTKSTSLQPLQSALPVEQNLGSTKTKSKENPVLPKEELEELKSNHLSLIVDANPAIYLEGKPIEISWKVLGNISTDKKNLISIEIVYPEGFQPDKVSGNSITTGERKVSIPWNEQNTSLKFTLEKTTKLPFNFQIKLLSNNELADTKLVEINVGANEVNKLNGGKVQDTKQRISLDVQKDSISEDIIIEARPPASYKQPNFSLSWNPMEIVAVGKTSGKNITSFNKPIPITMRYYRENIITGSEDDLSIYYYDENINDWLAIPTTVDKKNQLLTAYTDHLTVFDYKAESWQGYTASTVDNFKSDGFTGSATYNYSIWTPPGTNG
jgi:hypothetical protein